MLLAVFNLTECHRVTKHREFAAWNICRAKYMPRRVPQRHQLSRFLRKRQVELARLSNCGGD